MSAWGTVTGGIQHVDRLRVAGAGAREGVLGALRAGMFPRLATLVLDSRHAREAPLNDGDGKVRGAFGDVDMLVDAFANRARLRELWILFDGDPAAGCAVTEEVRGELLGKVADEVVAVVTRPHAVSASVVRRYRVRDD